MKQLLIASNNAGKLREFKALLSPFFETIVSPKEIGIILDPAETGDTFEENARIKCRAFRAECPGFAVLADDSGLEVDALGGEPGVRSARYAGVHGDDEANNDKLLSSLSGIADRSARFVSALVLIDETDKEYCARGTAEGRILRARAGKNGFGYDPIFLSMELGKSFGECSDAEKNAVSHRARAASLLVERLKEAKSDRE